MWIRKRIDIRWTDLAFAFRTLITPGKPADVRSRIESNWGAGTLACFSVRSSLDLFLTAAGFERGSEVLVSAITIPDMVAIIEEHGLVPVPVDLQPEDMAASLDSLKLAITDKTRMVLVAHLFGARTDLTAVVETAQQAGVLVFEDCAQGFEGDRYKGHPQSDAVAFSFGPIKTATALGGALVRVRNAGLLLRMREVEQQYPEQRRLVFGKRVCKYSMLKLVGARPVFRVFVFLCGVLGRNLDAVLSQSVRNFSDGDLLTRFRVRPCASQLRLMERRVNTFDPDRHDRRSRAGRRLIEGLNGLVDCPGSHAEHHSFWVFVVDSASAARLASELAAAGYDATTTSQLRVLMPGSATREVPRQAELLLSRLVFLPFYPELPDSKLDRMADIVRQFIATNPTGNAAQPRQSEDVTQTGDTAGHVR